MKLSTAMHRLLAVEKISLLWNAFTCLLILILWSRYSDPAGLLLPRIGIAVLTFAIAYISAYAGTTLQRWLVYARCLLQLGLLSYWYPDTFELNRVFPNLDHVFASLEQTLFSSQPSILFAKAFPSKWISEALNLGYFAYFPMMLGMGTYVWWKHYEKFTRWAFLLAFCFFTYYIIFVFVPVAGPQFYFPAIGFNNVAIGLFLPIHDYFHTNTVLLTNPADHPGFFHSLVELSQKAGERPTAAFPSSHVGISTILMLMATGISRKLFCVMLPFYVLLCLATVYIQAHYLIDSVIGFLLAFPVYFIACFIYKYYHNQPNNTLPYEKH